MDPFNTHLRKLQEAWNILSMGRIEDKVNDEGFLVLEEDEQIAYLNNTLKLTSGYKEDTQHIVINDWEEDELKRMFELLNTNKIKNWTHFNFLIDHPEYEQYVSNSNNYKKWWFRPKKLAERANSTSGYVLHSAAINELEGGGKITIAGESREISVCTLDTNTSFSESMGFDDEITLLGKAKIRLLFDVDCLSIYDENMRLFGTYLEQLDNTGYDLADLDSQDTRGERLGAIESRIDDDYDEGFVDKDSIEWVIGFCNDEEDIEWLSHEFGIPFKSSAELKEMINTKDFSRLELK